MSDNKKISQLSLYSIPQDVKNFDTAFRIPMGKAGINNSVLAKSLIDAILLKALEQAKSEIASAVATIQAQIESISNNGSSTGGGNTGGSTGGSTDISSLQADVENLKSFKTNAETTLNSLTPLLSPNTYPKHTIRLVKNNLTQDYTLPSGPNTQSVTIPIQVDSIVNPIVRVQLVVGAPTVGSSSTVFSVQPRFYAYDDSNSITYSGGTLGNVEVKVTGTNNLNQFVSIQDWTEILSEGTQISAGGDSLSLNILATDISTALTNLSTITVAFKVGGVETGSVTIAVGTQTGGVATGYIYGSNS